MSTTWPAPGSTAASSDASAPTPARRRNLFVRAYGPLVQGRTWATTLHLLLDLAFGIAWFTVVVTMLSVSAGLMVTLIGLPLLVATVGFGRLIGAAERARVRAVFGTRLDAFPRRHREGSLWHRARLAIGDGAGWRGIGYAFIALPWGILTFTLTVVTWSVSIACAGFPIAAFFIPESSTGGPYRFGDHYVLHGWGRFGYGFGTFVIGLALLVAAPRIIRGLGNADRWIVRALLSPDPNRALTERVEQLTVSRDASVEGAGLELRRIERDLHDGAQQRLVGLAMNLGLARERLASGADPERATELVIRAHEESKLAISELRDLVRGIHPSVLTDRGLDAALSALAARSPVPIQIDVDLASRPPAAIEAAAYFVVAESLTNIAKHSRATRGSVRVGERGSTLLIEIYDDGIGGAEERSGGGLSGLRDRIAAVEGRLRISSPDGGPTLLAVELPCGS
ncbi:MAG: desK 7 [Ilumatobacteraceae bacterium]|nr:desK 7 [Ilumatobacteraceae bacterium]